MNAVEETAEGAGTGHHLDAGVEAAARAGDAVALARMMVATPSVNPSLEAGGAGEAGIARLTAGWLDAWGLETRTEEVAPGRFNVVARLRGREPGPRVLLNGHLDTVGIRGMTIEPFGATVRDGRLHGRGACDMKGGVASILSAAARLAREGLARGELIVALTADEEFASQGMEALVASESGEARADAAIVCEPTELTVMPAHKGFVWLDFVFRGRAAHGSRPDLGVDAIRHAALYIAGLEGIRTALAQGPSHPLLGPASFHVGVIQGGDAASVYADEATFTLERRTLPGEVPEYVEAEFRHILEALAPTVPDFHGEVTRTLDRPGTEVPEESPVVQGLLRSIQSRGLPTRVEGMTAWVDAALLNEGGTPAVCFGPGSIAKAHTADESCPISEIEDCAQVLADFVRSFDPTIASLQAAPGQPT